MSFYGNVFVVRCINDLYVNVGHEDILIFAKNNDYEMRLYENYYTVYGDEFNFKGPEKHFKKYFRLLKNSNRNVTE